MKSDTWLTSNGRRFPLCGPALANGPMSANLCFWCSRKMVRQYGRCAGALRQAACAMISLPAAALTHSKRQNQRRSSRQMQFEKLSHSRDRRISPPPAGNFTKLYVADTGGTTPTPSLGSQGIPPATSTGGQDG